MLRSPALIDRTEFFTERWAYQAGQHVTVLGPTGSGKSELGLGLAHATATPTLPGIVLGSKPKDATLDRFIRASGFKKVRTYPPPRVPFWVRDTPGYVVWPPHTFDFEYDDAVRWRTFAAVMAHSYRVGNRFVVVDDAVEVGKLTDADGKRPLTKPMNGAWRMGRAMGYGQWALEQRPAYLDQLAYGMAEHLFIARDPDMRTQKRYGEIGGIDPKFIIAALADLPRYHFLYIRRSDFRVCIVGP